MNHLAPPILTCAFRFLWANHISRHVQGDKSPEREFKTIWELLLHYKKPTDRLKWHLTRCISWKYIPRGMLDI